MAKRILNDIQSQAVKSIENPVLIFAGAGSGKTRVLTHKIAYLIEKNICDPENILALTFTNKAAKEMIDRSSKILNKKNLSLKIGTFHSICAFILRSEAKNINLSPNFVIYDVQDQLDLLKIILNDLNVSKNILTPNKARNLIGALKNKMIFPDTQIKKARTNFEKVIAGIYKNYQISLRLNEALDFDDLILLPLELFDSNPMVLDKYQEMWKYILVDEYQDTNKPQFQFIKRLSNKYKKICVVGDDDQSIYGWRGAEINNILDFKKTFTNCDTFTLEKNYRSSTEILSSAHAVVSNNKRRVDKKLISHNGKGELLGLIETKDELEEADAIISALEKEIKLNKRNFNDFAILYRTNAQSRPIEDSLRRMGIPYNIVGSIRFYDRKEVKDILSYLRILNNLKDTVSLRRIINFPPRGIGVKTMDKCVVQAEKDNIDLFDVLKNAKSLSIRGKQTQSLISFYELIKKYQDLTNKLSASEVSRSLIEEAGIIKFFKDSPDILDKERLENVNELLLSIDEFCKRNPKSSLKDFLQEVSLLTDIDQWNSSKNRVTLMTVHASKGLEFPIVFIAGLDEGLFPTFQSFDELEKMEEERRLFYVAITRAKSRVFLLYSTNRRRLGSDELLGMPSRFINEIPTKFLEKIEFQSALTRRVIVGKKTKIAITRTVTTFDDFKVGDQVKHSIFGIGEIMVLSGSGENQRVGVIFKDGTKKKLIVKYANLTKVN